MLRFTFFVTPSFVTKSYNRVHTNYSTKLLLIQMSVCLSFVAWNSAERFFSEFLKHSWHPNYENVPNLQIYIFLAKYKLLISLCLLFAGKINFLLVNQPKFFENNIRRSRHFGGLNATNSTLELRFEPSWSLLWWLKFIKSIFLRYVAWNI